MGTYIFETKPEFFGGSETILPLVSYPLHPKSSRPLIQQVVWKMEFKLNVLHVSFCADVLFPKGFHGVS